MHRADDDEVLRLWGKTKPILFIGERPQAVVSSTQKSAGKDRSCSTGSGAFHDRLNACFDAIPFPQYKGRKMASIDEAIIYVPKGKKLMKVNNPASRPFFATC